MKKITRALCVAAMTSSLIVTPVFAEPSANNLEAGKATAQSEANSLQSELTELLDKMGKLEEQLISKGEDINKATEDLKSTEELEKKQYEDMKLRIKYMYESGDVDFLETLVTSESFSDMVNKAEYVQSVHTYDRKKLTEYVETKKKIEVLKQTLETEQKNLEEMQVAYKDQESSISATLEEKRTQIVDFDRQIQAAAEAAAAEANARETAAQSNQNNNGTGGGTQGGGTTGGAQGGGSAGGGNQGGSIGGGNPGVSNPGGDTSTASTIVNAAYGQLGVPYAWGGTTPNVGLDCSGLVQYAHAVAGIRLPRTSQAQGGGGVAVSNPQPGDLVCYGTHIGVYIGGGQMIHAPQPGEVVTIANVYGSPWYRRYW